jgi:hypothetical protein
MIHLLTSSEINLKKDAFKTIEVDGKTKFIKNGFKPVNCDVKDWLKAGNLDTGCAARKRLRMVIKNIKGLCNEARRLSLELDKEMELKKKLQ